MLKASQGPKISKNLYEKVMFNTGFKKGSHQFNENKEYFTLLLVRSLRIIKMDLCTEIHLANIKESNLSSDSVVPLYYKTSTCL